MSTHLHRKGRRARLLAAVLGVGMAVSLSLVAAPSPALAKVCGPGETKNCDPPRERCGYADYDPSTDHGRTHHKVEPTQMVQNDNPDSVPVTFSSTVSATVSSTASSSTTVTGGINLGIVNTSVSHTFGYSTTQSATTTINQSVGPMSLPSGMTQYGDYGVFRQKTSGTYVNEYWCRDTEYHSVTAYSVRGVGWKVWQA